MLELPPEMRISKQNLLRPLAMELIAVPHVLLDVVLDVLIQTLLPPFAVDVLLDVLILL